MANTNLHNAKMNKRDEFYTKLEDIENELQHYTEHFKDKVVYMNADNPKYSNFWKYFYNNFEELGVKRIVSTYFNIDGPSYKTTYDGKEVSKELLEGNGDFRSEESIETLKESDVVVTNPPFSLFREYVDQLIKEGKKFLIIGNYNAVKYKDIFPLIKKTKMSIGYSPRSMEFIMPNNELKTVNSSWFTNLPIKRVLKEIKLTKLYIGNEGKYPKYDNYDAIEVNKVVNIPKDYKGNMGVPITFLTKHNPKQFEILGMSDRSNSSGLQTKKYTKKDSTKYNDLNGSVVIKEGGKLTSKYDRIFIKRV